MSLRQLQTRNFLEFITSSYLASGKRPTDTEIYKALNYYFSQQPAGSPISLEPDLFSSDLTSDVDKINDFMASVQVNLDVMFEQLDQHLDQNLLLTTAMTSQMKTLKTKRKRLESKIDDILAGIYNIDGFFYSFSDDFYDATLVDFNYTDAFVDVDSGIVALPTNSDGTKVLNLVGGNKPNVKAYKRKDINAEISYVEESDFGHALDGLTNTAWYITIRRTEPSEGVFVTVDLDVGTRVDATELTQIAITPHGVEPVQCAIKKIVSDDQQNSNTSSFSSNIKTSSEKMIFVNQEQDNGISRIILELSKPRPDYYEDNVDGTRSGVYIIGLKELMLTQQSYSNSATIVSQPFGIPDSLSEDQVIGSVSLTVNQSKPSNTEVTYYVAPNDPDATEISDFSWREIEPISSTGSVKDNSIIDLGGAYREKVIYRKEQRDPSDLNLVPLNSSTNDPEFQNPTPAMFRDFSVYRIGPFQEDFLSGTISLEEGINTTKIMHTSYSTENIDNTFEFWKAKFDDPTSYESTYGEIDNGNGFFYGADIGENERSVYVETFIYSDSDKDVKLQDVVKSNSNSKLWSVRAFMNGREIASLPIGTNKVSAPVKVNRGKNSLVFAINIPAASTASLVPYIGSLAFDISKYGTVKLGDYTYVDHYKFRDNGYRDTIGISPNKWFTIHNNEIVTKSKLTDNYRLKYAGATSNAPDTIRVRADLKRFSDDSRISPVLDSYRVRFSYAGDDDQ